MRLAISCLLLAALVWAAAFLWPVDRPTLPDELVGRYRVFAFEPPEDPDVPWEQPPPTSTLTYEFTKDGTFLKQRHIDTHEIERFEGTASVGDRNELTLMELSFNREEFGPRVRRYRYIRKEDDKGRFLVLHSKTEGEWSLRPIE